MTGRARATLNAGWHRAGHQEIEWNGRDDAGRELPAGVYFARPADHAEGVRLVKVR